MTLLFNVDVKNFVICFTTTVPTSTRIHKGLEAGHEFVRAIIRYIENTYL